MDFAMLTDIITKAWSGKSVKQYKKHKDLKKENLRDHMTNLELVLNMLAEATTSEISKKKKPSTLDESKVIAKQGGAVAGNARKEIEVRTGDKVVSKLNAKKIVEGKPKKKRLSAFVGVLHGEEYQQWREKSMARERDQVPHPDLVPRSPLSLGRGAGGEGFLSCVT
jgi:hypothetical protein